MCLFRAVNTTDRSTRMTKRELARNLSRDNSQRTATEPPQEQQSAPKIEPSSPRGDRPAEQEQGHSLGMGLARVPERGPTAHHPQIDTELCGSAVYASLEVGTETWTKGYYGAASFSGCSARFPSHRSPFGKLRSSPVGVVWAFLNRRHS